VTEGCHTGRPSSAVPTSAAPAANPSTAMAFIASEYGRVTTLGPTNSTVATTSTTIPPQSCRSFALILGRSTPGRFVPFADVFGKGLKRVYFNPLPRCLGRIHIFKKNNFISYLLFFDCD
jgi:hypothetical protein